MKWQGRQGSDNVEDRRGMSRGKMAQFVKVVLKDTETVCGKLFQQQAT